ncbi:MAG: hypothetical protein JWN99_140 [Ilumatobacteraceae bacterium]|jgi:hypothetical protein|nr:hypothetical protein [Ilumatobacteraceae bacterium]
MGTFSKIDRHDESWLDEPGHDAPITDWADMVRLALIVSLFAGAAAMALVGHVSEMAIVVSVIVIATMASWFHLEHAQRSV